MLTAKSFRVVLGLLADHLSTSQSSLTIELWRKPCICQRLVQRLQCYYVFEKDLNRHVEFMADLNETDLVNSPRHFLKRT